MPSMRFDTPQNMLADKKVGTATCRQTNIRKVSLGDLSDSSRKRTSVQVFNCTGCEETHPLGVTPTPSPPLPLPALFHPSLFFAQPQAGITMRSLVAFALLSVAVAHGTPGETDHMWACHSGRTFTKPHR